MTPLLEGFRAHLIKTAGSREAATGVSFLFGPFGGLAAEKGKGWQTAGGAVGGNMVGKLAGRAIKGEKPAAHIARSLLLGTGAAGGAYLAHGKNKTQAQRRREAAERKKSGRTY